MIKTATPSVTQDSPKSADYAGEPAVVKQVTAAKVPTGESKVNQVTPGENVAQVKQSSAESTETISAESIHKELIDIDKRLKAWQDRVNELLNDPNNADKIVNLLNSIQYMVNRKAELNILARQFVTSSNGYSFQDHQSILHAGSVRRKDTEALRIIERSR
jgi:hypothetical protein